MHYGNCDKANINQACFTT